MKNIYSLKDDSHSIKLIQDATLNTEKYGIVSEHGLFGSDEWWSAIENKAIELKIIEGLISKVYMSGHNDFPQFDINSNGNVTSWERMGIDDFYKVGAKVKLEYVQVKSRFNNSYHPHVVNIWAI